MDDEEEVTLGGNSSSKNESINSVETENGKNKASSDSESESDSDESTSSSSSSSSGSESGEEDEGEEGEGEGKEGEESSSKEKGSKSSKKKDSKEKKAKKSGSSSEKNSVRTLKPTKTKTFKWFDYDFFKFITKDGKIYWAVRPIQEIIGESFRITGRKHNEVKCKFDHGGFKYLSVVPEVLIEYLESRFENSKKLNEAKKKKLTTIMYNISKEDDLKLPKSKSVNFSSPPEQKNVEVNAKRKQENVNNDNSKKKKVESDSIKIPSPVTLTDSSASIAYVKALKDLCDEFLKAHT